MTLASHVGQWFFRKQVRSSSSRIQLLSLAVLAGMLVFPALGSDVKAYRGQIEIPTYPWNPIAKHPYFRETDKRNIYPYPMLDQLSRTKEARTYRTVVLENEYLRVTLLPELGGKVHEVIEKTTGQPMFYVNQVVKPGLIGQCGAWTSGGIEWNTGPQGHTVSCMQPVSVEILPTAPDGSRSVAIGEVERIYRTRWTVLLTLRPGRSFLEETVRIYNATDTVRPYYFWNCTAMPNTPGFRFIYPMTLGCDHNGTEFYTWPISNGKDLSRGTNYQDASSIFAWHCDQDFFGSYDDQADHGVVAYANHHQVPGKKAWTWGQGGFGTMHQMDLTDKDGPYNEVQTGPLLTQAEVGRLEPHEAVAWQEWWYPVRGIGGFTYANRDLAVNAGLQNRRLRLRLIGTGQWSPVSLCVLKDSQLLARSQCKLSPREPTEVLLDVGSAALPWTVEVWARDTVLARFSVPLDLPARTPPAKKPASKSAAELTQAGWQDYLFARLPEAEQQFQKALAQDTNSTTAYTGLATLKLDSDPAAAAQLAERALAADLDYGMAHFVRAIAQTRLGNDKAALEAAWKAALDPAIAVPARALVARQLIRQQDWPGVIQTLSAPGPWQTDSICRNRLALAHFKAGATKDAVRLAQANLEVDPLDAFARSILWIADSETKSLRLFDLLDGATEPVLELIAEYAELNQDEIALRIFGAGYVTPKAADKRNPLPFYWAAYLAAKQGKMPAAETYAKAARDLPAEGVFPHQREMIPVLRWALDAHPDDGNAALYLGHLLFSLGRSTEGRNLWTKAADLGASPVVALRALGMASLHLDKNPEAAAKILSQANAADRTDPIVARDLAQMLFTLSGKVSGEQKKEYLVQARDILRAALNEGRGRSDFVALLARAQNRLGEFAETSKLLDAVRITVWEGAREAHDLFEEAHLALGKNLLAANQPAAALKEFDRALEYPANLATGKLEHAREAQIHYLRGNALAALGREAAAIAAWKKAADEPESKDKEKEEARQKAKAALAKAGSDS